MYLTCTKQASFSVQLSIKLCIKKVKNAVVVRKQIYDYISLYKYSQWKGDTISNLEAIKLHCFKHVNKKTFPVEYLVNKKLGWCQIFWKHGQRNLISIWVIKVENFWSSWIMLCHIQIFSLVMWDWSSC